ncbi:hypothetical protein GCM10007073_01350 [Micrococcus flavus]|nr:hypothetical protein GCM10007073_01350 [Micrococcus flavus]
MWGPRIASAPVYGDARSRHGPSPHLTRPPSRGPAMTAALQRRLTLPGALAIGVGSMVGAGV